MITTRAFGAGHVVHLEPMTGQGLLVRPEPGADLHARPEAVALMVDEQPVVAYATSGALHESEWAATLSHLASQGWEPLADEDGLPVVEGVTATGYDVVALAGPSVVGEPDLAEQAEAWRELRDAAGVVSPM